MLLIYLLLLLLDSDDNDDDDNDDIFNDDITFELDEITLKVKIPNKQIYQIGYNLQNFNSFLKFKISNDFTKNILIKEKYYQKIENIFGDKNINIINELSNEKYIEIFLKSCIFCDMIDCVYSNIILECIKFNWLAENFLLILTPSEPGI
jgi:hypothetical protein